MEYKGKEIEEKKEKAVPLKKREEKQSVPET